MDIKKNGTLLVAGAGGVMGFLLLAKALSNTSTTSPTNTPTPPNDRTGNDIVVAPTVSLSSNTTLKDGDYTTTVSYSVPRGELCTITITTTIKDNKVTAIKTAHFAPEHESLEYQNQFDSLYSSSVVGKELESISLSRVGGASLTTAAFMKALVQIQTQATN